MEGNPRELDGLRGGLFVVGYRNPVPQTSKGGSIYTSEPNARDEGVRLGYAAGSKGLHQDGLGLPL